MSDQIQTPDSQNDVVTTATHMLYEFQNCILEEMPNTAVIYDDLLSYRTALARLRTNANYNNQDTDNMPMFAYKRSVLREIEDRNAGKRFKHRKGCIKVDGQYLTYNATYGEFDITFLYFSKQVELIEKFEVVYNGHVGVTEIKEVTVDMDVLGDFKYFLDWGDLEEITIEEDESNHYKSLAGTVKVRGFFFTFAGTAKIIESIRARFIASPNLAEENLDEILGECIIETE